MNEEHASIEDGSPAPNVQELPIPKPLIPKKAPAPTFDSPRDEGPSVPQTRTKGTQSLLGRQELEKVNTVAKERRKIETLLKDLSEKKKELQVIETALDEKEANIKKALADSEKTKAQKVPEVKDEDEPNNHNDDKLEEKTSQPDIEEYIASQVSVDTKSKATETTAISEITEVPGDYKTDKNTQKTVTDVCSETGNDYVDKTAWKNKHEAHSFQYEVHGQTVKGFPLVQFPLPDKLKDLTAPSIDEFLHDFHSISHYVPTLTVQSVLSKKASDALKLQGVDMKNGHKIIEYLKHHLQKSELRKRYTCIAELDRGLSWPSSSLSVDDQVYGFFDEIYDKLKYLNASEIKAHNKRILKIIFKKLPQSFNYTLDEFMLTSKSKSISTLNRIIFSRRHIISRIFVNEGVNETRVVKRESKSKNYARELRKNTSQEKQQKPKPMKATAVKRTPFVSRLGDSTTHIQLQLYHPTEKKMVPVKGITDTGSDLNVANLKKLQPFILRSEPPKKIKNIKFPNDTMVPVIQVSRVKVMLVQDNLKLDLGEVMFFVVDSPIWNDVITGMHTLEAFGVSLQLKDAPKSTENK
eukprot:snap_masked-scaffold_17-processed-gene-5.5-mRNA-1 protein AED:1.00 eAED:1.00 QI:0/0/0/0/1/1/2/0/580